MRALHAPRIVAYTASSEDAGTDQDEGNYYLALIKGRAYPVPESQVHASDRFEAGWLVVKAQWFELVTTSPRCYRLQPEERTLVVNEMIRLQGVRITPKMASDSLVLLQHNLPSLADQV